MRIAFTSDIHADVTPENTKLLPYLASAASGLAPDVFIVAGDAANDLKSLGRALEAFEGIKAQKFFVPGNHDVWVESKNAVRKRRQDSWYKYLVAIPEVCRANGFHCLNGAPVTLDGVAFVGSLGWYDYSLRDHRLDGTFPPLDYERGQFLVDGQPMIWSDTQSAVWLKSPGSEDWRLRLRTFSTSEVFAKVLALLEDDLRSVSDAAALVCVLHTSPFPECIERKDPPDPFDAYEGSVELGQRLAAVAKIKPTICICGHRHRPLDVCVDGVRVLRRAVGYLEEAVQAPAECAEQRVGSVEV